MSGTGGRRVSGDGVPWRGAVRPAPGGVLSSAALSRRAPLPPGSRGQPRGATPLRFAGDFSAPSPCAPSGLRRAGLLGRAARISRATPECHGCLCRDSLVVLRQPFASPACPYGAPDASAPPHTWTDRGGGSAAAVAIRPVAPQRSPVGPAKRRAGGTVSHTLPAAPTRGGAGSTVRGDPTAWVFGGTGFPTGRCPLLVRKNVGTGWHRAGSGAGCSWVPGGGLRSGCPVILAVPCPLRHSFL